MNMRCAHNGQDLAIVMPSHNLCILIVENLVDLVDSNLVSKFSRKNRTNTLLYRAKKITSRAKLDIKWSRIFV